MNTELPVRSAVLKHCTGGLVVRWVTTSESPLLYVFDLLFAPKLPSKMLLDCIFAIVHAARQIFFISASYAGVRQYRRTKISSLATSMFRKDGSCARGF
jgi:hypothetical protein